MSEQTAYDPTAPEGESSSGSQYLSKKDAKWLIVAAILVFIGLIPVYIFMREKAFRSTCVKNMNGIMEAMVLYSAQHDDRFPPLYNANGDGEPDAGKEGYAYTWVSDVWPYKSDRVDFVCPTAKPEEYAYSANPRGGDPIPSTYGFYAPYASYSTLMVDHPESVVILAETSNGGSENTYDPLPYKSTKFDGMIIGWNNSNEWPDEETNKITRLAFPDTKNGLEKMSSARHDKFINSITANRSRIYLSPDDLRTEYSPTRYSLMGHWLEPVKVKTK